MRSGERCECCGTGKLKVYTTRTRGSSRVRYLRCDHCETTGVELVRIDDLGRSILNVCTSAGTAILLPAIAPE